MILSALQKKQQVSEPVYRAQPVGEWNPAFVSPEKTALMLSDFILDLYVFYRLNWIEFTENLKLNYCTECK